MDEDQPKRELTGYIQTVSRAINIAPRTGNPAPPDPIEIEFDGIVGFAWYSITGVDIAFAAAGEEKQIHRWLYEVTHFRYESGRSNKVWISARAGIRDASGDWDDPYRARVLVKVTALLEDEVAE